MKNRYFLLRHGQAVSNVKNIMSCWPEKKRHPLTKEGKEQVKKAAEELKKENIDLIFSSDILRTKQTSEIASKILKIKPKYDKRIREYDVGVFNGRPIEEYRNSFESSMKRFRLKAKKGENYTDIEKRMGSFLKDMERKYKGKNILVVSHQLPIVMFIGVFEKLSNKRIYEEYVKTDRIKNGEIIAVDRIGKSMI